MIEVDREERCQESAEVNEQEQSQGRWRQERDRLANGLCTVS